MGPTVTRSAYLRTEVKEVLARFDAYHVVVRG
jgi:hypothetical protein